MEVIIAVAIIAGFNCIPIVTNWSFPNLEKFIWKSVLITTGAYLLVLTLSIYGVTLKSPTANQAIGLLIILGYFSYYGLVQPDRKKFLMVVISVPIMVIALYTQLLSRVTLQHKINSELNLTISREGFMGCGEVIRLNRSRLGIFHQELMYDSNQCIYGIHKIETVSFDKNSAVLLLYHAEKLDTEYELVNFNYW